MERVDALLADYAVAHRTRGNLACHAVGITLIVFGVLSMLQTIPIVRPWTAAELAIGLSFGYYLSLDVVLGIAVTAVDALLDLASRFAGNWRIGLAALVVGWIFQGIGHAVYERRRPAFFRNLAHLLIGPAFLVNEMLHLRPAVRPRAD